MAALRAPLARPVLVVLACAVALVAAAPEVVDAASAMVTLTDEASPSRLEIGVGGAVRFENDDRERHRMRARDPADVDTSDIDPGEARTVRFPVAGTYRMVDERSDDPAYTVTVVVRDATSSLDGGEQDTNGTTEPDAATGSGSDADPSPPADVEVGIPSRRFSPAEVAVAVGGTVTWVNRDGKHTVTADDDSFGSGIFDDGGSFSHTFDRPGNYDYFCLLHPEMTGTVVVGGGSGGPDGAPTNPTPPSASPEAAEPSQPTADGEGRAASAVTLGIVDLAFDPPRAEVASGTTVTWVNRGELPHTVTSSGEGPLGSEVLAGGDAYRFTFDDPGTYEYVCALHPEMTATLVVTAAGAATAAPPPSASGVTAGSGTDEDGDEVPSDPLAARAAPTGPGPGDAAGSSDDLPVISAIVLGAMTAAFVAGRLRRAA